MFQVRWFVVLTTYSHCHLFYFTLSRRNGFRRLIDWLLRVLETFIGGYKVYERFSSARRIMAKQLWRMASWTVVLLLLLLRFVNVASGAETGDPTTSVQVEAARSTSTLVTSTSSSSPSASKTTASSEPSKTSSAAAQTHTISVGNGDHKFRPDVVQAEIGDVSFVFLCSHRESC